MGINATIDEIKSSVGRRGGLARSNRFAVYMAHPSKKGGLLNTDLSGIVGNFATSALSGGSISLGSFLSDPRDMAFFCESVSLPAQTVATNEFYTDLKAEKRPYAVIQDQVDFTFILTNDYYAYKYMKSWLDTVIPKVEDNYRVSYKDQYATDITIQQLGNSDIVPVYGVKLINAFPVSISAVELNNSADNTVTRVTVSIAYDYMEEAGLIDGAIQALKTGVAGKLVGNVGKLF